MRASASLTRCGQTTYEGILSPMTPCFTSNMTPITCWRIALMHMKTLVATVLVSVCFCAFGAEIAVWGEIGQAYSKMPHPNVDLTNRAPAAITLTNHGITQIGIERSACYGTCPVYTLLLNRDG